MTASAKTTQVPLASLARALDRFFGLLGRHWLATFNTGLAMLAIVPWLAPVFMHWGWEAPARAIYWFYSYICHQFPQRSWFLFGSSWTVSLQDVRPFIPLGSSHLALHRFIGNPEMGWKVAWSDRMVSFYGTWFAFGLLHALAGRPRRVLGWRVAALLMLPLALDGTSHMVSDLAGIGRGFRDSNLWLGAVTGWRFAPSFYAGDAWGSFNSLARLVTGVLASLGLMMWVLPTIERLLWRGEQQD